MFQINQILTNLDYYLTAAKDCPASHPIAYNNGASCCYYYNKINDASNPELDGSPLNYLDPEEFCADSITPALGSFGQKLRMNKKEIGLSGF